MRSIEKIELFKVPPRWLFLKVTCSDGLFGWGEPVVEGRADTVKTCVEEIGNDLIGQDPNQIEDIWQRLFRGGFYRGGPILMSALSGIDQALWDIKAKGLEVPVYELLGGSVRDRMKVYGWIGGDDPSELAEAAKEKVGQGFEAVKMNACGASEWIDSSNQVEGIIKRAEEVRNQVGEDIGIGIDFHGRIHSPVARLAIDALRPYRPMFIEEPVLPENLNESQTWVKNRRLPVAAGERLYSRWDFRPLFENGLIDIAQPDLSHAGGISEVRRIAQMAEAYDIALAPHCPLGPISFAAALQVDFASINAVIQESSLGIHYNDGLEMTDYLQNAEIFDLKEGMIDKPTAPGLGIEINEEFVREQSSIGHSWKNPIWRNKDGSLAEW